MSIIENFLTKLTVKKKAVKEKAVKEKLRAVKEKERALMKKRIMVISFNFIHNNFIITKILLQVHNLIQWILMVI